MMQDASNPELSAAEIHETLYDGADTSVTYVASVPSGETRTELVKVRKLPREEFSALALIIGDESESAELREAALYCGRPEEWAATLEEASLDRVLAEGQRLNFSSYARWFKRRARLLGLMENQTQLLATATQMIERMEQRNNTNGCSPKATATRTSGATRPTS